MANMYTRSSAIDFDLLVKHARCSNALVSTVITIFAPLCRRPCLLQFPDAVPKKRGPKTDVLEALLKRVDGLEARLKEKKTDPETPTSESAVDNAFQPPPSTSTSDPQVEGSADISLPDAPARRRSAEDSPLFPLAKLK